MKITEIERISGGILNRYYTQPVPKENLSDLKPLPGDSGFFYYVNQYNSVFIVLPDKKTIVGSMTTEKSLTFPDPNALQVEVINVDPNYRKQGLGISLYGIVLKLMRRTLVAGSAQTAHGRKMWVNLWNLQGQIPELEIRGYVSLFDAYLEDRDFDTLYGLLGADYLGETEGSFGSKYHTFAFDVSPNITGRELESKVKSKLSRIYNNIELRPDQVGLFAKVNQ